MSQFNNLSIQLFSAKVRSGTSKEKGRPWIALEGKMFPLQRGYGEMYFFEQSPSGHQARDQATNKPFAQGSTIKVEFNVVGEIVSYETVEKGFGPEEAFRTQKRVLPQEAGAPKTNGVPLPVRAFDMPVEMSGDMDDES